MVEVLSVCFPECPALFSSELCTVSSGRIFPTVWRVGVVEGLPDFLRTARGFNRGT